MNLTSSVTNVFLAYNKEITKMLSSW
jgi:hypothetical protein